ncbi:MAG: hypothetical protein H6R18_499 [Proteobacteria bacterium]|nr:hypothetical protein [Pseudomonadota bacterium]
MSDTNMPYDNSGKSHHNQQPARTPINEIQLFVGDSFRVDECDFGTNGPFDRPAWRDLGIFFDAVTRIAALSFNTDLSEIENTRRLFREEKGEVVAGAAIAIANGKSQMQIDELRAMVELLLMIMRRPYDINQSDIILDDDASSAVASVAQEFLQVYGGKIIAQPIRIEMPSTNSEPLIFKGKLAPKPKKPVFASPNPIVISGVLDALFRSERKILLWHQKENSKAAKIAARIDIERDWKKLISIFDPPLEAEFVFYEMITPAFRIELRLDEIRIDGKPFELRPSI